MLSKVLQSYSKIIDILKSVHVEPGSAMFTIADYGSADGGVQMRLLYACIEQLRIMHGKQLPIQVIHEDQLCNNFNALFRILQGGKLVLVQGSPDADDQSRNTIDSVTHLDILWKEMVNDGLITQEEFRKTTFAYYFRTLQEFMQPFQDVKSPVVKVGLSLISMVTKNNPCCIHERWKSNEPAFNSRKYGETYARSLRGWSNAVMASGLSDSRSKEEKDRILEELYKRLEYNAAASPDTHTTDYAMVLKEIEKN